MNPAQSLFLFPAEYTSTKKISKITIVYNVVKQLEYGEEHDLLSEEDTLKTVQEVFQVLAKEGFNIELFELNENSVAGLMEVDTDLFFNLCYGIGSIPKSESEVAKLLEKTGKPFTGATYQSINLTNDKIATKKRFLENNIPTPKFQLFTSLSTPLDKSLLFPLIVKPVNEHCSLGINENSVVSNIKELHNRLKYLFHTYQGPILVEEYIDGRELSLTLLGNNPNIKVLPISEIIFGRSYQKKRWKIVDFAAKWIEESVNYKDTVGICPASLKEEIKLLIEELAKKAYILCGCRDYARLDLRLSPDGTPYFLEININPGIGPQDGAVRSAKTAGMDYSSFLKTIIKIALLRCCSK